MTADVAREAVTLCVNGTWREAAAEPRTTLADFLREGLGLTGTHLACEHGVCGACTVLVDELPVRSCLMLAVQARDAQIRTIEGLAQDGALGPLQEAFRDAHSFQCGFCTPGFVMTAAALLAEDRDFTDEDLRAELSGNLCRCTGYQSILAGVRLAMERRAADPPAGGLSGSAGTSSPAPA